MRKKGDREVRRRGLLPTWPTLSTPRAWAGGAGPTERVVLGATHVLPGRSWGFGLTGPALCIAKVLQGHVFLHVRHFADGIWVGEKWGAVGGEEGGSPTTEGVWGPANRARPGQTKRRVDRFTVSRGPTWAEETGETGLGNHREVSAGSATRKLRPEGRPARPKRPPQAHPGSSSRGSPRRSNSKPLTSSTATNHHCGIERAPAHL